MSKFEITNTGDIKEKSNVPVPKQNNIDMSYSLVMGIKGSFKDRIMFYDDDDTPAYICVCLDDPTKHDFETYRIKRSNVRPLTEEEIKLLIAYNKYIGSPYE